MLNNFLMLSIAYEPSERVNSLEWIDFLILFLWDERTGWDELIH